MNAEAHGRPRAVIYAPDPGNIAATARCLDHVREHQYHLVGVVAHDFDAAQRMLVNGDVEVLVVNQRADLPPDRTPRFEVVAEYPPSGNPRHVRTVRINR